MLKKILIILGVVLLVGGAVAYYFYQSIQPPPLPISGEDRAGVSLMPLPAKLELQEGSFVINQNIGIKWDGEATERLKSAEKRFWEKMRLKGDFERDDSPNTWIEVKWETNSPKYPSLNENESYHISITRKKVLLQANSSIGVLRGLETLVQLVKNENAQLTWPACHIEDAPNYPWRGIMLDVSRHWMPKEVIIRTLEGMEAVKMNVFHWHLTDDQGFRVESKAFPRLHELGSGGNYYTQKDIREVVDFAAARGIRIVPEFDVPGHSTSWLMGYPEMGSGNGPYRLPETFGIKISAIDPTNNESYEFLDTFFEEMAQLFPDEYMHIGGDEVNPAAWGMGDRRSKGNRGEEIGAFIEENGLEDAHGLQAYFNQRVYKILEKHGKKMMGWDEILHPDLPENSILIQAWRSHIGLFEAASQGYEGILSNGWYLDHKLHADKIYEVNPRQVRGGVNIEPDSIWETYKIDIVFQDNTIPSQLTLFGEGEDLRGVWGVMDNLSDFSEAELENNHLNFSINSPMGTLTFNGEFEGEELNGKLSLALLNLYFEGRKIGGSDVAGTQPPEIKRVPQLSDEQYANILGGEACMWSEVVSFETVDSRIWPRSAAIAEKLWTPEVLTANTADMYRRLDIMNAYLTQLGLTHETYRVNMLEQIAPNSPDLSALETFVSILEETKYYQRLGEMMGKPLDTPLRFLADAAAPESAVARAFANQVEAFLADSIHQAEQKILLRTLRVWEANNRPFVSTIQQNLELMPYKQMSSYLSATARIGMKAVHAIANGEQLLEDEKAYNYEMLEGASLPVLGAELAVIPAIRKLVDEAYQKKN